MDEQARNAVAPTGRLRAAINLANTLFTRQEADASVAGATGSGATGSGATVAGVSVAGVSVDVMRELAARLGVPLEIVIYPTPGDVADVAHENAWDATILAIEPARAKTVDFSPPITAIEATYLVHNDSPLRNASEVDAAGIRISAPAKAGYELFLTRTIRNATLVRTKTTAESIDAFVERRADALSGLKPSLIDTVARLADARMLEGTFMTVNHGIGTPRGRPEVAAAFIRSFVDDLNARGFIAQAIARHQVKGLSPV